MRSFFYRNFCLGLVIVIVSSASAYALPAIACHCFTDRSFDAAKPAAADPYFLATTQNSFFAAVFNVDKKSIVMKKQQGTSSDDLWIAYWIASKASADPETLLQARRSLVAWSEVVDSLRLEPMSLGVPFREALNANAPPERLSVIVVNELFAAYDLLSERDLTELRNRGATNQDVIIATVIAARMKQPAKPLYLEVKNGGKTWGALLESARIEPQNLPYEIAKILK